MVSTILHRLPRSSAAILSPARHTLRPTISHRTLLTTSPRLTEGDLANPQSTSSEQSSVKTSRATKDQPSTDTASVQKPVSNESSIPGTSDEGTPTEDEVKRDPGEPAAEKRKHVERQGEKPLGPEDHQ